MSAPAGQDSSIAAYYELYHQPDIRGFNLGCQRSSQVFKVLDEHIVSGSRCLDVGCGDGHVLGPWAVARGIRYVGVDIAKSAVEATRARGLEAVQVEDSGRLPFPDGSFDAAVSLEVIEHLFQPEATLREAVRVVRPGGVVVVSTPNVAYWRRRLDLVLLGRWNPFGYNLAVKEPWNDPHIRFFNPGSLGRFLTKVGCERVEVLGQGGNLSDDLPWIGHRMHPMRRGQGGPLYRGLERRLPSLLGCFLTGIGRKPVA
jgi:methionine biosynthesis protein MetW